MMIFPKRDSITWLQTFHIILEIEPRLLPVAHRALQDEAPLQILSSHLPAKLGPISPYSVPCKLTPPPLSTDAIAVLSTQKLYSSFHT